MLEWVFNGSTNTLDYWVRENVSAGGELLISYGTKSNAEYLLHYGFAVPGLPQRNYSVCTTKVPVDLEGVPDEEGKRKWLIKASFSPVSDYEPVEFQLTTLWDRNAERMMAHARLLVIPTIEELTQQISRGVCDKYGVPPQCPKTLSVANEVAALRRCLRVVQTSLAAYPTKLEQDEALMPTLDGLPLSMVLLRRDEKFVLRWWERFFSVALAAAEETRPGKIAKNCQETLGEAKCTPEMNPYMRETLYHLLGGEETSEGTAHYLEFFAACSLVPLALILGWHCSKRRRSSRAGPPSSNGSQYESNARKASSARKRRGR